MKSGLALVAVGFLILVASVGWWLAGRPSVESGDAAAVEELLTPSTTVPAPAPPSPITSSEPPDRPSSGAPEATPLPRFTVADQAAGDDREPVALRIPAIAVEAPIIQVGVEPDGDMEVPRNVTDVGWYEHGPAPGEPGSAVLAAHVDLARQGPGVFFNLRSLEPGDVIHVAFSDGTTEAYRAVARTIYDKADLPTEAIFSRDGPPILTLITCGGGFNRSVGSYDSNVVVYAVPSADRSPVS